MKHTLLYASIMLGCGILFVNVYNSVVDAENWISSIPNSIETARKYFTQANPRDFFKIIGAILQPISLIVIFLFWKSLPQVRWYLIASFVLLAIVDIFTFAYFFPRNDIIFRQQPLDVEKARLALKEWRFMNWVRSLIMFIGVVCSCIALHKSYTLKNK